MRLISLEQILNLKGAADACFRLGGGVTSFALLTRVGTSTLVKYASRGERKDDDGGGHEHDTTLIPADIAVEADMRAGSPVIVTEMARLLGFRLEPLGEKLEAGALTEDDVDRIMDEATEVWREARAAFADGRIDALEKKRLGLKFRRLIRAAECAASRLEAL